MEWPKVLLQTPLPADLSALAVLADQVEEAVTGSGLPLDLSFKLNVALDEIITNIVSYGAVDGVGPLSIEVTLRQFPDRLEADVTDNGVAFDPLSVPPPDVTAAMEDRTIGGLGIHLVRNLMDKVAYSREGERNRLKLVKAL